MTDHETHVAAVRASQISYCCTVSLFFFNTWLTDSSFGGESAGCWKDRGRRHHGGRAGPRRPPRLETRTPTHARASRRPGWPAPLHVQHSHHPGPGRPAAGTTRHHTTQHDDAAVPRGFDATVLVSALCSCPFFLQ